MSRQANEHSQAGSKPRSASSSGGRVSGGRASTSGSADPDPKRPSTANTPPKPKVDVSHFPHYGLKRGMACTFCRRRKLKCSGDRPSCTNCVKYTKVCEYGPPVKDPSKKDAKRSPPVPGYDAAMSANILHNQPQSSVPPLQAMPIYSTQATHDMPMKYAQGSGGVYADQQMMGGCGSFVVAQGAVSYQQQAAFDPYHQQQSGYITPPIPTSQTIPQQPQFAQALPPPPPPQAMTMPHYVSSSPSSFGHWQPTTPALPQTSPGILTHHPGGILSDSYTTEPPFDAKLAGTTDNLLAPRFRPLSSESTSEGAPSARQSSTDSLMTYSPNSLSSKLYLQTPSLHYVADVGVVDGLTDRLGEFLFNPIVFEEESSKRRKGTRPPSSDPAFDSRGGSPRSTSVPGPEYDGLTDSTRSMLLDCFLKHSELFLEMSVPRFRYRLTFSDRRRPSLALLNAMYMWGTRIMESGRNSTTEKQFFDQAFKHIHVTMATTDRLLDAVRAAFLLSMYSFLSSRHHEGWCLLGMAVRMVQSCGLHKIPSCTLKPAETQSPFLRHREYLLSSAEDTVELAERIHTFWAVFAIDRCSAFATGYPSLIQLEDVTTPFPLSFSDIAAGAVSERDDCTVRDLYLGRVSGGLPDTVRSRWMKCNTVLERASKICFQDPEKDSPWQAAWSQYSMALRKDGSLPPPPEYLNQPKFRNPKVYQECILAIDQLIKRSGDDGVFPPTRCAQAHADGQPDLEIPSNVIMFHHMVAAVQMTLHDIDSLTSENVEALKAARKSVQLFQSMPLIPHTDVDGFIVKVWFFIGKTLNKEVHRFVLLGDMEGALMVAAEVEVIQRELSRIGQTMHLAKTQAVALEELKVAALSQVKEGAPVVGLHLDNFLFPQHMS